MSATAARTAPAATPPELLEPGANGHNAFVAQDSSDVVDRQAYLLRVLWNRRRVLSRIALAAIAASTLIAFLIPKSYTSTAELMPPDSQASSGLAMMAALTSKTGPGMAALAGDLLGLKSSGALFIGVLRSQTSQDQLIHEFALQKVYGTELIVDARKKLDENTIITEDRKSGIISISVTDHSPERAAGLANAYVDELNSLVAQLSTSAAHRERVFLEDRLKVAKVDLDDAVNSLAQFSSRNNTLDIQTEGKAMLDAASILAGQLVAAQAELEGLRQIYTDNNARVKALSARVAELRKQLERLGGGAPSGGISGSVTTANATGAAMPGSGPPASRVPDISSGRAGSLPFPTIRNLPLLGAKYADYYRRAKIQETVFELLTEQYELAKVEEAKETPSVKVLDPGELPERKSSPSRLLIIFLGTFLAMAGAVVVLLGRNSWEQTDANDPRKRLGQEIMATVKARLPFGGGTAGSSANGDALEASRSESAAAGDAAGAEAGQRGEFAGNGDGAAAGAGERDGDGSGK